MAVSVLLSSAVHAGALHHYTVAVDEKLETIRVRACFDGVPPRTLRSASGEAWRYLEQARVEASGTPLRPAGRELRLGRLDPNACVAWQVNAGAAVSRDPRRPGLADRVGDDLVTSPQLWFWRPRTMAAGDDIELHFELPPGVNVSFPWPALEDDPRQASCRVGTTPYHWAAAVAFGSFERQSLPHAGMTLRLAVLGGSSREAEKMASWLHAALANVALAYGRLPRQSPQVMVIPVGKQDEPVPFGRVVRGGGAAVQFFVDLSYSVQRFTGDWTATHEFSHLLLPYVSHYDSWLSEGVATYYQNVLMARAGEYSEARAWQKLHEGFGRGRRNVTRGQSLAEASRNMHRDSSYMRVYWSGAAIALAADVELRKRTGGQISLDEALKRLGDCCLNTARMWRAREILIHLDELTGETVFLPLYERYINSGRFPELDELYEELGLRIRNDQVVLDGQAPLAHIRQHIMSTASQAPDHD